MIAAAPYARIEQPPGAMPVADPVAVPVFYPADSYGSGWYRCVLPARATGAEVRPNGLPVLTSKRTGLPLLYGLVGPVNVWQRPADLTLTATMRAIQAGGREAWIELDDDIWALDARNPLARPWTPERRQACTAAIKCADGVTVSTPRLAEVVAKWNRNIHVCPNGVEPNDFQGEARVDDGVLRVGWVGSYSHLADMEQVLPALHQIGTTYPNVEIVFQGYDPFQGLGPKEQETGWREFHGLKYLYLGWTFDLLEHYRRIAMMDVTVAPVLDTPFNQAKSPIKWFEHSLYATPMVVSGVRCYTESVRHGETAFVAKSPRDWLKYLTALVKDADVRRRMGEAARTEVLAKHTMAHRAAVWREALWR